MAARDARYAVTAAALAEAEAEAASALAHAEAEHAAQAHELMREVSPDSLADAERIADQIASETRARSSRKAALARATAKAKAAAAKDAAEKAKALYESDEVMAAAGHLGPVAWEAGVMADSALGAVASCAASLSSLDKVEAEQAAYVQQEAIETSQKTAEAAMAAMSAIQVMESFFEAKRAGMPAEPSLNDAAMDSIAAIEVAEKAFEMIRADEGEDETAELGDDCAAMPRRLLLIYGASITSQSTIIPKELAARQPRGHSCCSLCWTSIPTRPMKQQSVYLEPLQRLLVAQLPTSSARTDMPRCAPAARLAPSPMHCRGNEAPHQTLIRA